MALTPTKSSPSSWHPRTLGPLHWLPRKSRLDPRGLICVVRCASRNAEELGAPQPLAEMELMLNASMELTLTKAILTKYNVNPRSKSSTYGQCRARAHICDVAWALFHRAADASTHCWVNPGPHNSSKPRYINPSIGLTPSRLKYVFNTVIAQNRILRFERLCAPVENGDPGDVVCALPKAWVKSEPNEFELVREAVMGGQKMCPPSTELSKLQGENGICVGRRC
jgi:hypothetical protein